MTWTWARAREVVGGLDLPSGQYAVGITGRVLCAGGADTVDVVDLLVTPDLLEHLRTQGWQPTRNVLSLGSQHDQDIANILGSQLPGGLDSNFAAVIRDAAAEAQRAPLPGDTLAHPSESGLIATASDENYNHAIAQLIPQAELVDGLPVLPARLSKPHVGRALIISRSMVTPTMTEPTSEYAVAAPDLSKAYGDIATESYGRLLKVYGTDGPPPATIPLLGGIRVSLFLLAIPLVAAFIALVLWALDGPWLFPAVFAVGWLGLQFYLWFKASFRTQPGVARREQ